MLRAHKRSAHSACVYTQAMPLPTETRPLRRDAQANRDRIVTAARSAFAEHGIDAPVEEIARRAGVGMGTVYRRFPTKEELVDAVFEDTVRELAAVAREALEAGDAWEGFSGFLERAFVLHVENRGLKDVALNRGSQRSKSDAARAELRPLIALLVARAQEEGALRADFRPEDVPVLFWSISPLIAATSSVAPDFWRRQFGFVLDGLHTRAATPALHPPLTRAQLERASERRRG
jgi:AcrR family transcriptional regulator